jgi:cytochrome c oxidase subunit 1
MIWPTANLPLLGHIQPETYLSLLTMHGTIMVFFVLTTAPQGGFGNYFLPIQIGAPDMAFPLLNMLSFWTTFIAFVVILAAFFVTGGAPLHGWTVYAPLSALPSAGPGEQLGADLWIASIAIFCVASLMGAELHHHHARPARKGHDADAHAAERSGPGSSRPFWIAGFRRPALAESCCCSTATSAPASYVPLVVVNGQIMGTRAARRFLATPVLVFRTPRGLHRHPARHGRGLPAALHLLAQADLRLRAMVYAILGIGFLGFMVWGHHMFMSGMSPYSALPFPS